MVRAIAGLRSAWLLLVGAGMANPRLEHDGDDAARSRRRRRGGIRWCAIPIGALGACTGPPEDLTPPRYELPLSGTVQVVAAIDRGDRTSASTVKIPIVEGAADVDLEDPMHGVIAIDRLELALQDVTVPESIMPGGATLTDLRVALDGPVETDAGAATVDASLDWSIRINGRTWPLARQRLERLSLGAAALDDRQVVLEAEVRDDGVCWSWADVITFSALVIDVRGER